MEHSVKHDLGRAMAKKATQAAFAEYAREYSQYKPEVTWHHDYAASVSFTVKGATLKGKVDVNEHDIALDLDVPFLLRPFKSKALEVIEREIREWIEKARRGELD